MFVLQNFPFVFWEFTYDFPQFRRLYNTIWKTAKLHKIFFSLFVTGDKELLNNLPITNSLILYPRSISASNTVGY